MTADEFARKLWITESAGRLYDWGDDGLAMGAYQQHPAWMFDWAKHLGLTPTVLESWNHFEGRLVRAFFTLHSQMGTPPTEIAMKFHLGHACKPDAPEWDKQYAARFEAAPNGPA